MIVSFVASIVFSGLFFLGERIFTRKRTLSDYAIIWFLIFSGMLISSVWANEPNVDNFTVDKQASKYTFPPKNFEKATTNAD